MSQKSKDEMMESQQLSILPNAAKWSNKTNKGQIKCCLCRLNSKEVNVDVMRMFSVESSGESCWKRECQDRKWRQRESTALSRNLKMKRRDVAKDCGLVLTTFQ